MRSGKRGVCRRAIKHQLHEMPAEFSRYVAVVLRGPLLIPSHPQPKEGSWPLELFRDAGASSPCWQILIFDVGLEG
jgi:hypothetical protein